MSQNLPLPRDKTIARLSRSLIEQQQWGKVDVIIRVQIDELDAAARDLAAYLGVLDGAFGRTHPSGYLSYSHRPNEFFRLREIKSGSALLDFVVQVWSATDVWQALVVYVVARTIPGIVSGQTPKNWAEAIKTAGEATLVWKDVAELFEGRNDKLTRHERRRINDIIMSDPLFAELSKRDRTRLVDAVAHVFEMERGRLRAAGRFSAIHVRDVALKVVDRAD